MILPRYSVFPMKYAICAKTRLVVPESPSESRSPEEGVGPRRYHGDGGHRLQDIEYALEVALGRPCHFERKFSGEPSARRSRPRMRKP
jgi:hypothetical protein